MSPADAVPLLAPRAEAKPVRRGPAMASTLPLCVDLDGTLVRSDLLEECLLGTLRDAPLRALRAGSALYHGRAALKHRLAREHPLRVEELPYNEEVLDYLRTQKQQGRRLILVTAADSLLARRVAAHLGLFDDVLASEGGLNLKGATKAAVLTQRFGERGFVYMADAAADLPVWRYAAGAILVNPSRRLAAQASRMAALEASVGATRAPHAALLKALRPHQWIKNVLVFAPALLSHSLLTGAMLGNALLMFLAFCLAASGSYLINDLYDLNADRRHPRKRARPFASGELPLHYGLFGPGLIVAAILLAAAISWFSAAILAGYVVITTAYSYALKKQPLVDVFVLASLYTLRLVAGAVACGIMLSNWLLALSGFLFLALATVKRVAELGDPQAAASSRDRRGYQPDDAQFVQIMGVASSFTATMVLALYVDSMASGLKYQAPLLLWGAVPVLLFWQCRLWLAATRGSMHDDPIVFAARDRVSWLCCGVLAVSFLAAGPVVF